MTEMLPPVVRVLDIETNGPTPDKDEFGVCEIGYADVVATNTDLAGNGIDWVVREGRSRLVNPGTPMTPETMAVHHIIDADVASADPWKPVMRSFVRQARSDGVIAFAAHSADMEASWVHPDWWDGEPIPFLCSYKTALRVWPDAPGHGNQVLRYWHNYEGLDRDKAQPVHRAGPDSYVTAFHIARLLNDGTTIEQMIEWTKEPALLRKCYLKDYRNGGNGTPWEEVDSGLINWIVNIADFSDKPDVLFTAKYHLRKREEEEAAEREREDLNQQLDANGLATVNADGSDNPLVDPNQGILPL